MVWSFCFSWKYKKVKAEDSGGKFTTIFCWKETNYSYICSNLYHTCNNGKDWQRNVDYWYNLNFCNIINTYFYCMKFHILSENLMKIPLGIILFIILAMKKILPLFAILLAFAWCWTQEIVTTEEPVQEVITVHAWDTWAMFSYEWISIVPIWSFTMEELKSNNQFQKDAVAWEFSKYLIVWYWFLNETKEPVIFWPSDMPFVFDSEWRKFNPDLDLTSDFYVVDAISFFEVKPSIPTQWMVVYEVPKNATWFNIQAWNLRVMLDEDKE